MGGGGVRAAMYVYISTIQPDAKSLPVLANGGLLQKTAGEILNHLFFV